MKIIFKFNKNIKRLGHVMLNDKKLLDASTVSKSYSITITKRVIGHLGAKKGDRVSFCEIQPDKKIILTVGPMTGGEIVLGTNKLSINNTVVLPEPVREMLKLDPNDQVAFYKENDGRISIKT